MLADVDPTGNPSPLLPDGKGSSPKGIWNASQPFPSLPCSSSLWRGSSRWELRGSLLGSLEKTFPSDKREICEGNILSLSQPGIYRHGAQSWGSCPWGKTMPICRGEREDGGWALDNVGKSPNQGSGNLCCEGQDSKYLRLCGHTQPLLRNLLFLQ